ncbi:class A beta-lactamase [Mycobacterium sp. 852002-51057_SCH5723018]|uniref:class A beta-lactamase n=1 Tax=Mycobacterium sp. 852002-51057_SCH5723018 TaxID=1834094 RepID=UPI0008021A55|nr:class A beta-lactamase [Mycobacterium sp. 852002-51057_SCH5723018]OBG26476.1 class A beta-lactamase [Mycobacterium sp. 852002-51057_SCH5723018]
MPALSRRRLPSVAVAASVLTACGRAAAAPSPDPSGVYDRLGELEGRYDAYVGLFATDLGSGRTLAHRDGDPFAVCSTFKAYSAARVLQLAQRGELDLRQAVFIDPGALLPNSPVTAPQAGRTMPLAQLCAAALQRSDNAAANLLLRAIGGPPAVTDFARSLGDEHTRLDRWETDLNTAIPGDPRDTSTPRALGGGIQSLLTGTVLGEPQRRQLEDWMRGNVTSTMRASLPPGWTSADKTGTGDYGSTNDIGIAYGPGSQRVLLSVMTRSASPNKDADALGPLIAEVTGSALPWLTGQG